MRVHSVSTQERVDRRRAQILAAASRVFARQGFHRTTVRQVAREAGIADGTIYLYFDSKQELLLALLGQLGRVGERPADFAELAGADARASLSVYLRQRFGDLREWRQLFTAVFPEVLADAGLRAAQTAQVAPAFEEKRPGHWAACHFAEVKTITHPEELKAPLEAQPSQP